MDLGEANAAIQNVYNSCDIADYHFFSLSVNKIIEAWDQFFNFLHAVSKLQSDIIYHTLDTSLWYVFFLILNKILRRGLMLKFLSAALKCIKGLSHNHIVVIVDGGPGYEGTDSLLLTLVQLMVDPYYCSIKGFLTLIDKEWILRRY